MDSSLDHPDDVTWRELPHYSEVVASRLTLAYAHIARRPNRVAAFLLAAAEVAPCLPLPMAEPQRLRACYVEALAHSADKQDLRALDWVEQALEIAIALDDQSALVTLLYLHGAQNTALLRNREAVADFEDSRMLLRARGTRTPAAEEQPIDAPFELHLTLRQVNAHFLLGRYDQAERLLDEARALVPFVSGEQRELAVIPWWEALLYRWRGEPERALRPALAAAAVYAEGGNGGSAARIQTVTADIALDFAAALPEGTDRHALLQLAQPHLALALQRADEADDEPGSVLARLTGARASRMRGDNIDRLETIEWLARAASRLDDVALLAQAFTVLGDELASQGDAEREAAMSCYRQVLAILDGSDVPALGVWARRALHHADVQGS